MTGQQQPTFTLRLRPEPNVTDPTYRLRLALKMLLRRFGLRAISVSKDNDK